MAHSGKPPLRLNRRGALLLACLAALPPGLARSAAPTPDPGRRPRLRISVGPFDVTPSYISLSGDDASRLIEAALMARLEGTGCCKVLDAAGPLVRGAASAPPPREALPAQFVIAGSVTVNSPPDLGYHTFDGPPDHRRGSVEIDVRLSDARTGMVLDVFRAERSISASKLSGSVSAPNGTAAFFASPLGQATDLALTDIVSQIAKALAAVS